MGRRGLLLALAIVAVAGAVRFGVVLLVHPVLLVGDEHYYLEVADSIAAGEGHHSATLEASAAWPPGQAFWLSRFLPEGSRVAEMPSAPRRALLAQAALGTLAVALIVLLGHRLAGLQVGLVAGAMAAVYPDLVFFSHALWATNLFVVWVCAAWCAVTFVPEAEARAAGAAAVAAGLLFGLAALTRESALVLAAGAALWCVATARTGRRRAGAARAALLLAACAATVAPWTLRNAVRLERLVPVSEVGWMAMREGNTLHPEHLMEQDGPALAAFRRAHRALPERARSAHARREAIARIRDGQPLWIAKKTVRNLAWLASPGSLLLSKLSYEAYGPLPLWRVRGIAVACVVSTSLLLVVGVLGLAGARGPLPGFALAAALPLVALHVVANASPRYRMPLVPLLLVGCGSALVHGPGPLRSPRTLAALGFALFFVAVAVPAFAPDGVRLWRFGSIFGP